MSGYSTIYDHLDMDNIPECNDTTVDPEAPVSMMFVLETDTGNKGEK